MVYNCSTVLNFLSLCSSYAIIHNTHRYVLLQYTLKDQLQSREGSTCATDCGYKEIRNDNGTHCLCSIHGAHGTHHMPSQTRGKHAWRVLKYARWDGLGIQTMWAEYSNNVNYSECYALLITISGHTQLIPHLPQFRSLHRRTIDPLHWYEKPLNI